MNASHAWAVGMAEGTFRAAVLAVASIGAAVLAPLGFLAVARGRGFGTRATALLLAVGCLAYTSLSSLGFIATARDASVSGRSAAIERHDDRRALIDAARRELAGLKGRSRRIMERREDLTAILVKLNEAGPAKGTAAPALRKPDAQSSALAFYIRAAGWQVSDAAVGVWLNLVMVLILEMGAALSMTVAAGLRPVELHDPTHRNDVEAPQTREAHGRAPETAAAADPAPARTSPRPRGKGGRPVAIHPQAAVDRLRKANGQAGSIRGVAKVLGTSKSTAHRTLHKLAALGLITLTAGVHGVSVALV